MSTGLLFGFVDFAVNVALIAVRSRSVIAPHDAVALQLRDANLLAFLNIASLHYIIAHT